VVPAAPVAPPANAEVATAPVLKAVEAKQEEPLVPAQEQPAEAAIVEPRPEPVLLPQEN
jgi:hypothetical protein